MAKKNRKPEPPKPPKAPKWIERSHEKRSSEDIATAIKARSAFRRLRRRLGLTQPELANELGISLASVQGIESGYRPVARDVARMAQARFGVFANSLTGFVEEPVTLLGEPVSKESVARVLARQPVTLTQEVLDAVVKPLEVLLRAAANSGKLLVFGIGYKDMIEDLTRALRLWTAVEEYLGGKPRPISSSSKFTWGQIRKSPELAEVLGITDDPRRTDDEEINVKVETKPRRKKSWFPQSPWLPQWSDFVDDSGQVHWSGGEKPAELE